MGLKAGRSVPDGGCSFTLIVCMDARHKYKATQTALLYGLKQISATQRRRTFGTAAWKRMLVTGMGADDSMEMMTTRTSGRDGGWSRAKCNRTRKLCLSKIVTGNMLPVRQEERRNDE